MYVKRQGSVWASELAEYLNLKLIGPDFLVQEAATASRPRNGTMIYLKCVKEFADLELAGIENLLILTPAPLKEYTRFSYAVSTNPRLDFVLCLDEFLVRHAERTVHPSARVADGAVIGRNVHLGANVSIGPEVIIGDNVVVHTNSVIAGTVHIGNGVIIKENTVIGSEGYGFVLNRNGNPVHVPHLGAIFIEDLCWIGANTTIERAEIDDTTIGRNSKIDDMVHVGGGCHIGARSMLTAGSVIGSGVRVGEDCWLALNTSIKENVRIGSNTLLGMGSVALSDLDANSIYVGTPAKFLKKR